MAVTGAAREHLAPPPRPLHQRPWAWAAALVLHILALLLLTVYLRWRPPPEQPGTADVAVVFDHGGAAQATAPPTQRRGPDQLAAAPKPPPPPPPPPAAAPPEVNLILPTTPFAQLQSVPEAPPQPAPPRPAPPRPHPVPPQRYVMMDGMSYGSGTRSAAPAPPEKSSRQALNLSLPQSDTQAVMGSNFTVKGHIGADYMSELHKWVEEHGYYPDAAAAQGQEGNAVVEFTVDRTGRVTGARLVQSSGSTFIDQAWLQLFADNALPPFPPGTKANKVTIEYTGEFHLIR